jgi:hypothetical protein
MSSLEGAKNNNVHKNAHLANNNYMAISAKYTHSTFNINHTIPIKYEYRVFNLEQYGGLNYSIIHIIVE